jgi:hypothetical protein
MLKARYGDLPGFDRGGMVGNTHASTRGLDGTLILTHNLNGLNASIVDTNLSLRERLNLQEEELAAAKEHLAALKQARSALASTVTDRLRGDIFGGEAPTSPGDRPDGMAREDWLWLQETKAATYATENSPIARLRQQISDARQMRQVLRQLARKGLGGAALAEVAATASLEEMQALLAEPNLVNQFERLYGTRQRATRATGQYAGSAVYDKRIDRQTVAVEAQVGELRQIKQRLGKLEEVRQETKRGADRIVGAVKGVSGDAARRHR